jgi:hypothetical protein
LYGFVYVKTVATVPKAIFYVTVVTIALAGGFLSLARVPKETKRRTSPVV